MACQSCGAYLIGKTYIRQVLSGPFRLCRSCGAPMGEIPRPRFGDPDKTWITWFTDAFKGKDDARALTVALVTIESDTPKILTIMDYLERLSDESEGDDSPHAWVNFSDLYDVLGEAIDWTLDFQLAISFFHSVVSFLQGKASSVSPVQYTEQEELMATVDQQIREKGIETVYYEHLEAASRTAADVKKIVSQTHDELVDVIKNPRRAPILSRLDSIARELTPKVDQLWSTRYAVFEMDHWSTAS